MLFCTLTFMGTPMHSHRALIAPITTALLFSLQTALPVLAQQIPGLLLCQNDMGAYPNALNDGQYQDSGQQYTNNNTSNTGNSGQYYQGLQQPPVAPSYNTGNNSQYNYQNNFQAPNQYQPQPQNYQTSQYPGQAGQYSQNNDEPTYYGYAANGQGQQPPAYGNNANMNQGQMPQSQSLDSTANAYFNQADQSGEQAQNNQTNAESSGSGMGGKLLQAGKTLAGVAAPLATGYFLTKAANRQARLNGYPGQGYYGSPYGYGMNPMGQMGGMVNPYGNGYGGMNPMGSMGSMGGGLLNMFGGGGY